MTLTQTFIGSFLEVVSLCFIMNLFQDKYLGNIPKAILLSVLAAALATATDLLYIPVGYIVNYAGLILLFSVLMNINLFNVFFEFLFGLTTIAVFQIVLLCVNSIFLDSDELSFSVRLVHLILILVITFFIGTNKRIQLLVRPYYSKYNEIIYLIAGNLFLFVIIQLYLWDSNHEFFLESIGVITAFLILWCCINGYLMKKLVENHKQNKLIKIHEHYLDMTENLIHGLYAEKHEFKRHLQTIGGMLHTETPENAVANIKSYLAGIEKEGSKNYTSDIFFKTGDSIVNGLLYSKCNEAFRDNINFYIVPTSEFPEFECEKFELVEVIGNLIDNAFDYVKELPKEDRKVILKIEKAETKKKIEVINTFYKKEQDEISAMSKKGYSTKTGDKRGYGLYNVKRIAAKYGGTLNIYSQGGQLVVQVLF